MQPQFFRINKKKPMVTYTLIGINVLVYVVEVILETFFFSHGEMLILMGAKVNELITLGQYWRLLTATFLHSGFTHILFNAMALYIWGPHIEALLGRGRYIIVYLASGLYGSLLSYLCSSSISVGASGAIFGLFGTLLYFRSRHRQIFNSVFGMQVLVIIGFNLINGFLRTGIDNFGHIGGLVGGFCAAYATGLFQERWNTQRVLATIAVVAVFIAGFCFGIIRYSGQMGIPPFSFL